MALLGEEDIELGNLGETCSLLHTRDPSEGGNDQQPGPSRDPNIRVSVQRQNSSSSDESSTPHSPDIAARIWSHRGSRTQRLNTQLLEVIRGRDTNMKLMERLLKEGANSNATCSLDGCSACHLAAYAGGGVLELLMKFDAVTDRRDDCGRRPLHLAAWSGMAEYIAILLNIPDDLRHKIDSGKMSPETEAAVKRLTIQVKEMANVQCDISVLSDLPENWKDIEPYHCGDTSYNIPVMEVGWTPLHAASSNAHPHCVRLLLAVGADPNIRDLRGHTPLDVAGSAYYQGQVITDKRFSDVIEMLIDAGGKLSSDHVLKYHCSPLHIAVELASLQSIMDLLDCGASVTFLNQDGQTPLHLCVKNRLKDHLRILVNHIDKHFNSTCAVDLKDNKGYTVLHAAVKASWVPGVRITLEVGADVTSASDDGQVPLHSAAALGDLEVLNEVVNVAKHQDALDYKNILDKTALFVAVEKKQLVSVKELLKAGASIKITDTGKNRVYQEAVFIGHSDILQQLLNYSTDRMFDYQFVSLICKLAHCSISTYQLKCYEVLINKYVEICAERNFPFDALPFLITAIEYNRFDIAKKMIEEDNIIIPHEKIYSVLQSATRSGCRETLKLLLQNGIGTDTAIELIMSSLHKPTEFIENIFDESIDCNEYNIQDPNCYITIDYKILLLKERECEQLTVLKALLETGNMNGQRELLLHPLVESFLYLKWMGLSTFFYCVVVLSKSLFVVSFNIHVLSVFYSKDTGKSVSGFWNPDIWKYFIYITAISLLLLECLSIKSFRSFCSPKFSFKFFYKINFIFLAVSIPSILEAESISDTEWPRHLATVALLISWFEMMILLSETPYWGYYVLMFWKVALKLIKILLTFLFVVMAFAFSFTIQFHSMKPFENPWAAFIKTMVMMTSEFDYGDTFGEESSNNTRTNNTETDTQENTPESTGELPSIFVCRLLFVGFLILAAIVLMNLMLGVAVTDLHKLVVKRKKRMLKGQIIFLDSLEGLASHRCVPKFLRTYIKVKEVINIYPTQPVSYKHIPKHVMKAILAKALARQETKRQETDK